jgi:cell wall-associated NlpC family hydrolase
MDEPTPEMPPPVPRRRRGVRVATLGATLTVVLVVGFTLITPKPEEPAVALPVSAPAARPEPPPPKRRPQVVKAVAPGEGESEVASTVTTSDESEGSKRASDEEVERDLKEFREALRSAGSVRGARARVDGRGEAIAPANAPEVVAQIIEAGNRIATKPYLYGGGHGGWRDRGYDCSGSVSFALAGAGLLDRPMASGGFMRWGSAGEGRWVTIYANPGHMFMVVAGLRFDTSGRGDGGTRWQEGSRGGGGYEVRHPPGL